MSFLSWDKPTACFQYVCNWFVFFALFLPPPPVLGPSPDAPSQLPAPQNLKIHLYNMEQVLGWEPGPLSHEAGPLVYQVQFK